MGEVYVIPLWHVIKLQSELYSLICASKMYFECTSIIFSSFSLSWGIRTASNKGKWVPYIGNMPFCPSLLWGILMAAENESEPQTACLDILKLWDVTDDDQQRKRDLTQRRIFHCRCIQSILTFLHKDATLQSVVCVHVCVFGSWG